VNGSAGHTVRWGAVETFINLNRLAFRLVANPSYHVAQTSKSAVSQISRSV